MAKSVNPATLIEIKDYKDHSDAEINDRLLKAQSEFENWSRIDISERIKLILKLGEKLSSEAKSYAKTLTEEVGKTFGESVAEIKKCAATCEYFGNNAEEFLRDIETKSEYTKSFVTFEPLGVVLAVMPWNFPFWQVLRAAVPAILAGNTIILKHASNVSGSALLLEKIFKDIGAPEGLFQTIIIPGKDVERIIANKIIKAVTFTGSTDVGRKIAETAGSNLKKCVLELGGNDPYIVLEEADIELAAKKCSDSRLINGGQSCISAKRFIVSAKIYDQFLEKFTILMKEAKFGDPFDKNNKIGPLVSEKARDEIHDIVLKYTESGGCKIITGGFIPDLKGAFYPPTVLEVEDINKIEDREIFGPVATIYKAKDDAEAIKIANDSSYGLGAAIFSKNIAKAEELGSKYIQAGCVFINDFVKSDPRFPFGGTKESGYGRELSEFGIREFTNIKTIIVA